MTWQETVVYEDDLVNGYELNLSADCYDPTRISGIIRYLPEPRPKAIFLNKLQDPILEEREV